MTGSEILFLLVALLACGGAVGVVICRQVVWMAVWLMISLAGVAGLFFLLSADFVGAAQLLVYVGGTVVLLIFGVMLTGSAPALKIKTSVAETLAAAGVGVLLLGVLFATVCHVNWSGAAQTVSSELQTNRSLADSPLENGTVGPLGLALLGLRADRSLADRAAPGSAAGYLLPFEIVSVHLLVVLIGAAYLARAKRRLARESTPAEEVVS
ncbi:MAG: hypothetical protein D6725_02020 [Planctomycetota bacterium]|nr:MAG: hypothetical protein D6725_02020 [Planctomycetota bacterium]